MTYGEKKTRTVVRLSSELQKRIKAGIKPKLKASHIVQVNGETLNKQEAAKVWTGYLAAQVSWHGPQSPAEVLQRKREGTEPDPPRHDTTFDDTAHQAAAKEVRDWEKRTQKRTRQQTVNSCFSFSEYCDAQATLNAAANTSPVGAKNQ